MKLVINCTTTIKCELDPELLAMFARENRNKEKARICIDKTFVERGGNSYPADADDSDESYDNYCDHRVLYQYFCRETGEWFSTVTDAEEIATFPGLPEVANYMAYWLYDYIHGAYPDIELLIDNTDWDAGSSSVGPREIAEDARFTSFAVTQISE